MRRHVCLVATVSVLGAAPLRAEPPKELSEAAKRELKGLEGKWRVVRFIHPDRETTPGTGDDAIIVTFKSGTIGFAGVAGGLVVDLDPGTDPKCLDFKARVGSGVFKTGQTYESVYKLDGDALSWAVYTGQGKNRPVGFDKPTEAAGMVMMLHRVRE